MPRDDQEERRLRSAALQNAQSILQARQGAEEELVRAQASLELKAQELARSLAMLRGTLESTSDGLLVTTGSRQVTAFNERFVQMWRIPPHLLEARDHDTLLQVISAQSNDPPGFLAAVDAIYAASAPETFDLLQLADGRVFERFSRIQVVEGQNVGRVWSYRDVTERHRAEEALHQQAESLRVTMASIGDGVITTDTEGRVTSLNAVAESLTGWTQAEAGGLPLEQVFRIVNEHTREPVPNPAMRALREGRIVGLANHTVLVARDGTERAIDDSAAPIKDETGRLRGVVLIFRDVSGQRGAEAARLHLAAVVDSSDDAIISKTLDGIIQSWNEGARRIFGYTADEVIGKPITILLPKDRHYEEEEILRRLRRGDRLDHFETGRVHKDGRPIMVSVTASPIRDQEGRIIGASKIARDITARRRAEESARFLADASAVLAERGGGEGALHGVAVLAVSSFADWCAVDLLEPDGSVRRLATERAPLARPQLAGELGHQVPSRTGELFGVVNVMHSGVSRWAEAIPDTMLSGAAEDEEELQRLRNLGLRSFLCVPLRSGTRVLGALTFVTADSGRVYGASDLRAAEDLCYRAVIAMENANLLATLKESDQRKDEFLAMLAHELRNPLAPIRNATQIIRVKAPQEPDLQWAMEVIDRQVDQMTRLVDDLLDVSRITRGKIQLHMDRIEIAAVVNGVVDATRPVIEQWGHRFTVTMPSDPMPVAADMTRLSQVLLNLLDNAAKYTEAGGHISLTVEQEDGQVAIRVKDTGVGIAPEMLGRIFDMFTQADRSLDRAQGGLGIGLTLVRRLVEMHGGTVRAHSEGPGKGSEFVVRLPSADQVAVRGPQAPTTGTENLHVPAKRRVLIVDDNEDSAHSMSMLLRMLGHDVRTAHDGLEAVQSSEQFQPDLVLLDIGLPRLNGYDTARRIREDLGDAVVLVAVTGWGQEGDRQRSREAGFDHHLTKPVELSDLQQLLSQTSPTDGAA